MIADLKKLLAECHMTSGDHTVKVLGDAKADYLMRRAEEEIRHAQQYGVLNPDYFEEVERRLKLAIQLINIARYKHRCNHLPQSDTEKPDQKPKSKKASSGNSKHTTG